ncbi:MAG TPA: hypothetical protein EYP56_21990 [Planctomycetaceae bacterium]|nr:hypothetical protein [Planctomycetaceae bacterium]HIQ22753.1 hypothetical protein [Planctomycetota bacterium]
MSLSGLEPATADQMRCPTCGARQPWSDSCRRCRCDLTLLRDVRAGCQQTRRQCLVALDEGRLSDALRYAYRRFWLSPDAAACRLLAVCHLLAGNWIKALRFARLARD